MTIVTPNNRGRTVREGVVAGIAGGIIFHLYIWLTVIAPQGGSMWALWQWAASVAIGKIAMTNANYAWLGLLVLAIVAVVWASGYAFFATGRAFVNARWALSGIVYGIVVYVFMQILLLGANSFSFPATPNAFVNGVIAVSVFFGLPVAFVVARMNRTHA